MARSHFPDAVLLFLQVPGFCETSRWQTESVFFLAMISHIPPSSRIGRIVLVALLATLASVIFVAAHKSENELPPATPQIDPAKTRVAGNFAKLPLSFELNKGQIDQSVKFLSHGAGYDLFLTATEAVLRVDKPRAQQPDKSKVSEADANVREGAVLRLKMLGANATPQVEGQDELPGKVNYFAGNDPAKWRRNIPTYRKVHFTDVYPGIDVLYYGKQRELEYDFVVAAGANPKLIRFTVEGADKLRLDKDGRLLLNVKFGDVSLNKPVIYQLDENGSRREVKGTYVINGNEVRFKLDRFDSSKPLIIDPVLSYSTLLGSSSSDIANGIAVDSQGSAYVTGTTDSTSFPTTAGSFKSTSTRGGAFVTKLDPTGSTLVYSTYLSGSSNNFSGNTSGSAIAVDSAGNAYITGNTSVTDFPIVNGLKTTSNFSKTTDAAVNWSNQNTGLVGDVNFLATGTNAPNTIYAATTDGIYRSTDGGGTWSKTPSAGLQSPNSISALVVDPSNASVVYAALFNSLFKTTDGGNNWSQVNTTPASFPVVNTIVVDPVTPSTMYIGSNSGVYKSTDSGITWITQNNFNVSGTPSIRVLAIDPTAPLTIYAGTFFNGLFKTTNGGGVWTAMNTGMGGPSPLNINTIAIDPSNTSTIYTGHSSSGGINKSTNGGASWTPLTNGLPQFPVVSAMVATPSAVYAGLSNSGVFKSTNGGDNWTSANAGLWSASVRALIRNASDPSTLYAGTSSSFFSFDAYVTKLNPSGSGLLFSTLLGGSSDDNGNGIAVDANGNIYVAGQTSSLNFPVANAVQGPPTTSESCSNAFVTKLNPSIPSYVFSTYLRGSSCDTANAVATDSSGNVYVTGTTSSNDFFTANAFQPALAVFNPDAFVTKLTTDGAAIYSTYLGGANGSETGFAIAADSAGNAYVTGSTGSGDFPTVNPIQGNFNGNFSTEVFLTKINSQGSALVYSTFLGGTGSETGRGIAVDSANNVYITGSTSSLDFPLVVGTLRTKSPMYKSIDGAANWTNDNFGFSSSSITCMVIHPGQPSTIYAGTSNGVFKTTNGGRNWFAVNNGLNNFNVVAIVINPSTPNTLYVATNGFGGNAGIYKTNNGGSSWFFQNNGIVHTSLLSLAIDPVTPNTLYLGVDFCCVPGTHIYKTNNGGDSWAMIPNVPVLSPTSLAIDPLNHVTIYATDGSNTGGVWKSTDGGDNWQGPSTNQTGGFGRSVSVSPLTAGLVYADAANGLFKSIDGGTNWTAIPNHAGKIVFDPVNAATVYLLTQNFFTNIPPGLSKSTDNGQTWIAVNKGLNSPQASALVIDPQRPSTLYLASPNTFSNLDAFVTKINPAGNALIYSTLIGGPINGDIFNNINSQANGIAVDTSGNAYITGFTSSQGYPVTNGVYQPFNRGGSDAFITKLGMSFNISGVVLSNGVTPLGGAEVVLNDNGSLTSVITESDGTYQFVRLREGGNYTVSAAAAHFTMTPASQTFNNLSSDQVLNFTANTSDSNFFNVGGQITENGVGLAGVTVTLSGSQSGLRTTDSNGNYSFDLIMNGNYTVTPTALGFTFGPASQTFNNLLANQTANFTANRQSFVVTNANNHGTGSLRDAITNANATLGTDTITFNIPGPGVKTISLLTTLPEITERVVIDATTQPGYAGAPLIELDGLALNSGSGLVIKASGSTVRGLAIVRFRDAGISLNSSDNNVIQANYIGVAADGTTARANSRGILIVTSSNNVIGGTSAAARNLISGNSSGAGIEINGSGNIIQGNFIGTNAAGTAALTSSNGGTPSQGQGVAVFSSQFVNNVIGGTVAGAGNVISGNQIAISNSGNGTIIQGNLIGTDVTGTIKVSNSNGISSFGTNVIVGGLTPEARNIVSGNLGDGVSVRGAGSKIQGNYIGTDISGSFAIGNNGHGVSASDGVVIGGTEAGARNIISGNGASGNGNVALGTNSFSNSPAVTVLGNYIGTDVTGTRALGGLVPGIRIFSSNNTIGGTDVAARNVISGNSIGIQLGVFSSGLVGNVIQGNFIGLNAAGTAAVPNTQQGIAVSDAVNNTIGGVASGAGNTIAFNLGPGITMSGGAGNTVRGNSIFSNNGLGIDLLVGGVTGVTPNDVNDSDAGANNLQNFPVITTVLSSANSTTIQGSLKSIPLTTFQIDFYSNAAVDPSGNGEGAQFFNTTAVTTDANGNATINATFPAGLPSGRVITATATDPNGNTSEFSAADSTGASGSVQFNVSSIAVIEDIGSLTVTVVRSGGSTGSLTVDYATTDGTAIAGQDYTAASGTLTFNGGETSKTIQIPIADDSTTEPDETFTVTLRNPSTLESLGSPSTMTVTIQDRTTTPLLTISSPSVVEGSTGSTTDMVFTLNLSAATGRTVTGSFATANVSAFGGAQCNNNDGVDYLSKSSVFSFQPGATTFKIPVTICGDTNAEANETFRIFLSNVVGAGIIFNQGVGFIVDDDVLGMLLEESGPNAGQAAALDAVLLTRDPFRLFMPDWFAPVPPNTRVMLFAQNLQLNPGEPATAVNVRFVINNNFIAQVTAESVRPLRDSEFTQVVFRLPNTLTPGTYSVFIIAHNQMSNGGTIRIAP